MSGAYAGAKAAARSWLERRGLRIVRVDPTERVYQQGGFDGTIPLPAGAEEALRSDNPRLLELKRRYTALNSPLGRHTLWDESYRRSDLDLANFRGDNIYVWQLRNMREQARLKYFLQAQYLRGFDSRGLLNRLLEDGQFGCWTFSYHGMPRLSRDMLDSINELYFLDRTLGLFARKNLTVLDIGAGYGRLAHRMCEAVPSLKKYYCVDAVPESTFLCEYYLRHRGCLDKVSVVPLDEIAAALPVDAIDLAVNVHSFSEVPLEVVGAWLDELVRLRVRRLLIVPNDSDQLLTWEADRSRQDYRHLLVARGFQLTKSEPICHDPDFRELIGVADHFFLFERADV